MEQQNKVYLFTPEAFAGAVLALVRPIIQTIASEAWRSPQLQFLPSNNIVLKHL